MGLPGRPAHRCAGHVEGRRAALDDQGDPDPPPQGRASGAPAEITYYSEERPEVMGAATFASLDVSVWHMPERDMAGIALRGSGLRSLGSSPAVADEGEVEL